MEKLDATELEALEGLAVCNVKDWLKMLALEELEEVDKLVELTVGIALELELKVLEKDKVDVSEVEEDKLGALE